MVHGSGFTTVAVTKGIPSSVIKRGLPENPSTSSMIFTFDCPHALGSGVGIAVVAPASWQC